MSHTPFDPSKAANAEPLADAALMAVVLRAPQVLPTLGAHSARVFAMAGRMMTVDIAELLLLVRSDPVSAAALLRTANSPAYWRGTPIEGLDEAIIRLGRREVYSVLMAVAARGLFEPRAQALGRLMPEAFRDLQHRSVACAFMAGWLTASAQLSTYEEGFVTGLFAQVGQLGVLYALGTQVLEHGAPLPQDPGAWALARPALCAQIAGPMLEHLQLGPALRQRVARLHGDPAGAEPHPQPRLLAAVRLVLGLQTSRTQDAGGQEDELLRRDREMLGFAETQMPTLGLRLSQMTEQVSQVIGGGR